MMYMYEMFTSELMMLLVLIPIWAKVLFVAFFVILAAWNIWIRVQITQATMVLEEHKRTVEEYKVSIENLESVQARRKASAEETEAVKEELVSVLDSG